MKVLILNQYKSDNIGDQLIGLSMKQFFNSSGIDVILGGYAQTSQQDIALDTRYINKISAILKRCCPAYIKYWFRYKKRIFNEARDIGIDQIDAIIIGGGQLIKHGGVFPYCFHEWADYAIKHEVPLFIYGIGVDDNIRHREAALYKRGVEYAKAISCRDKQSARYLSKITDKDIAIWPDVVFSNGFIPKLSAGKNIVIMPYDYNIAHFHFSTLSSRKKYYNDLYKKIKSEKYKELILSSTTSSDLNECYRFGKFLEKRNVAYRIVPVHDIHDLVELYSGARKIYSGRMHALIIGMLCGIEIEPIEVSDKIQDFRKNYLSRWKGCAEAKDFSMKGLCWLQTQIVNND